jgi:carbamoyltransferase
MKIGRENTLAIHGSHDAGITFIDRNNDLRIFEYERFTKRRFAMYSSQFDHRENIGSTHAERVAFLNLIFNQLLDVNILQILYSELSPEDISLLRKFFPDAAFELVDHHFAHACSGYYLSHFKNALIFSVDGGGPDYINGAFSKVVSTQLFYGSNGNLNSKGIFEVNFGEAYSSIGHLVSEIRAGVEGDLSISSLSYAGKLMGLAGYGSVREDWLKQFQAYYTHGNLERLCAEIDVRFEFKSASGTLSFDLAATSQHTFEVRLIELMLPYIDEYGADVVFVGGCALNVLFNERLGQLLRHKNLKLFVPSIPNDSGLSCGMFLSRHQDDAYKNFTFGGLDILDRSNKTALTAGLVKLKFSYSNIVKLLKFGCIIGVLRGSSEVGPRALGNRSIICDPSIPDMKDRLNLKVKFREWFRPFAPVCRDDDLNLFFADAFLSPHMSYAPKLKSCFQKKLLSVVHVDGSSRLQTVNSKDNPFFYKLLTEFADRSYLPMILNTSFNIRGAPILTTVEDAVSVLCNTDLDCLIIDDDLFVKSNFARDVSACLV